MIQVEKTFLKRIPKYKFPDKALGLPYHFMQISIHSMVWLMPVHTLTEKITVLSR
jgi:hypothetical protein